MTWTWTSWRPFQSFPYRKRTPPKLQCWGFEVIVDGLNTHENIFSQTSISGLNLNTGCCKCRLHVWSQVPNVCEMLTQRWHWIIAVGSMVNLASWEDGDPFFFFSLFAQWRRSRRRPCQHFIQQLRCGFIQILWAQSCAQKKKKKIRNGDEFQQRGQKNSANSLQMLLRAVRGNTVLPSLERKRTPHWRKFSE